MTSDRERALVCFGVGAMKRLCKVRCTNTECECIIYVVYGGSFRGRRPGDTFTDYTRDCPSCGDNMFRWLGWREKKWNECVNCAEDIP